jgi:5-methylcytosine-specific restriction protein A
MPNFPGSKRTRPKAEREHKHKEPRYHTTRWRELRLNVLQCSPLCATCEQLGLITLAQMVDHIKPVRLGGEFWDVNNLQPLCNSCHAVKSAKEGKANGNSFET